MSTSEMLLSLEKLNKDIKEATLKLSAKEARFLVDTYYIMQDYRIRTQGQIRSIEQSDAPEPNDVLKYIFGQMDVMEENIRKALDYYSESNPVGKWARSQKGIGPVIASGLLAHIDIAKANTAGKIWSFAGLDPTKKWIGTKGVEDMVKECIGKKSGSLTEEQFKAICDLFGYTVERVTIDIEEYEGDDCKRLIKYFSKRPWNAKLKTLCWKIGESFVKVSGYDDATYGKLYVYRKNYELMNNEAGMYRDQAVVGADRVGKTTEAYKSYSIGKLPAGHIHARAKRWAVKMFLSHYFEVAYREHYKTEPPKPFVIAHMGHVNYIAPKL